jgi:hypothetical protein
MNTKTRFPEKAATAAYYKLGDILPDEYINAGSSNITEAFTKYAQPLTGELPKTYYLGNHPKV